MKNLSNTNGLPWITTAVLLGSAALANAATYVDTILADGPVHYWRFEESAGTSAADIGTSPMNGTYAGGINLAQPSFGNLGGAIRLDGANGTHVALGGAGPSVGGSITVEAWVNMDVDTTTGFAPVVARWDGGFELDVNTGSPDALNFVVRNDSNDFANGVAGQVSRGDWHHVVGVFDGTTGTAISYLDGVPGAPVTIGGVLQNAGGDDGNWYIGRTRAPDSGFAWDGLIDEVAIYDYALSQSDINAHIAASIPEPSAVSLSGLLGLLCLLHRRRIH